jgi:hypothetical protein
MYDPTCDNLSTITNNGNMSGGTLEFQSAASQQRGGIYNYTNLNIDGP